MLDTPLATSGRYVRYVPVPYFLILPQPSASTNSVYKYHKVRIVQYRFSITKMHGKVRPTAGGRASRTQRNAATHTAVHAHSFSGQEFRPRRRIVAEGRDIIISSGRAADTIAPVPRPRIRCVTSCLDAARKPNRVAPPRVHPARPPAARAALLPVSAKPRPPAPRARNKAARAVFSSSLQRRHPL